ncbi:MAG: zf-HC2 domain-containing protein [Chloroflexi bacterium]|nr:zf-HC2 domain-containing protein [Chloroflexota bacterium]
MRCQDASELLSQQMDCPLDESEQHELDTHLAECESCQHEAALMRQADTIYAHAKFAQPPPDFANKVMERIRQRKLRRSLLRGGLMICGISLLIVLGLGLLTLAFSPLLRSSAQYPSLAYIINVLNGLVSIFHTFDYAIRLTFTATAKSGFPFIMIGYLFLAIFLIVVWARVLLVPKSGLSQVSENRQE